MHERVPSPDHPCCGPRRAGHLACPRCGSLGRPVPRGTVARFAPPEALAALGGGEVRFCPDPGCPVAYYAPLGQPVLKDRLPVRTGVKEAEGSHPICHCFGHSRDSLAAEWAKRRSVSAVTEVMARLRAGECRCEELNPQGVCCLSDLRREVLALQGLAPAPEPEPADPCATCSDPSGCESCG